MRCTKTISPPGMASYRKSSPHRSMMEMCCSCFMDTKYKCLRCSHKMAFTSKSTPTSPNLQRTTYHFVQKRKIWRDICGLSEAARFRHNVLIIKPYCRLKIELISFEIHNISYRNTGFFLCVWRSFLWLICCFSGDVFLI